MMGTPPDLFSMAAYTLGAAASAAPLTLTSKNRRARPANHGEWKCN
jgi:hypothetical protein